MKNFVKISAALALALTLGAIPAAADVDLGTEPIVQTVSRATPIIDGSIDPEYMTSFSYFHEWHEDRTPDNYVGHGSFAFTEKVDNIGRKSYVTEYGWDLYATSYYLWDDENIYIAAEMTDGDRGCLDSEHYGIASQYAEGSEGPNRQDGAMITLTLGERAFTLFASRDGRLFYSADDGGDAQNIWCDLVEWNADGLVGGGSEYAVGETERGYIIEMRLKVREGVRTEILRNGGAFGCGISVIDASDSSVYIPLSEVYPSDASLTGDSWLLSDYMILSEPGGITVTLEGEAQPVLLPYDMNGDGKVDSKDLVRLMRVIAGDAEAVQSTDINGDDVTNSKDLTRLMKHLSGQP